MKQLLLLSLMLLTFVGVNAQDYTHSVGIRGGYTSGVSYRYYFHPESSVRFLVSSREKGLELTALKEVHRYQLFDFVEDLALTYGVGAHVGYQRWDEAKINGFSVSVDKRTKPVLGLDALIGLEYHLWQAPVSFGVELKPFFDVFGKDDFDPHLLDIAFTVRFNFN
ncbi:hypothetical protein EMN47_15360 [Prolixibacteraceae bacterium JC049]|nr:hypothetical protein [Prolixibacteraceae bacterium JC049]